jgi:superfamily I DNA/RNA helicase
MAKIIPAKPRGRPDKAFTAFYKVLKALPDDFTAWLSLDGKTGGKPHVFLVWRDRHAFLIQVAGTSQQLAESALQADFFQREETLAPEDLGKEETGVLEDFVRRSEELLGPLAGGLSLRRLVVFPNVAEGTVDEVVLLRGDDEVSYLGMNQMRPGHFARRLEAMAVSALPETGLLHLRRVFSPETEVPESFVPRLADRGSAAGLPPRFLDFDQEWCVKNDLDLLDPPDEDGALDGSVRLVTGVAGSGKSLVLLYRALLAARLHPSARVLVLTHNKPLRHELERRCGRLSGLPRNVDCLTFFQWAARCLRNDFGTERNPLGAERVVETVRRLRDETPALERYSAAWLADEIGWIKDQRILRKDDYLEADRSGRGIALGENPRREVWRLFSIYQKHLEENHLTDWHNIALRFHDAAVVSESLRFPVYDAVFVDEAQFFAKSWFEIVNASLKPGGHLFLAADPTQGFLRRRQSWLAAGIEVRGRTTRLTHAYRNTRAILRFAREFYQSRRQPEDNEGDLNVPDEAQVAAIPDEGETPVFLHVSSVQDEIARAINETKSLRDAGLKAGQLLLLHANSALESALRAALERALGKGTVHDAKSGPMPDHAYCSVTTLQAATGLEAPVVMILGMDHLLEAEGDLRLSDDERRDLHRDHTRMLYMGFTRAGQRLIILRRRG